MKSKLQEILSAATIAAGPKKEPTAEKVERIKELAKKDPLIALSQSELNKLYLGCLFSPFPVSL
jgi:hypothetical protein